MKTKTPDADVGGKDERTMEYFLPGALLPKTHTSDH